MKGYPIDAGYMGFMPDGKYHLFVTETEYIEMYQEAKGE